MKLSEHFTFNELTATSKYPHLQEQNRTLAKEYVFELTLLANYVLEPVRAALCVPLIITSGFRCEALNNAVGGSSTSQHLKGQACDFVPKGIDVKKAYEILKGVNFLRYGQLILENGWLHISLGAPFRDLSKSQQAFVDK